MKLNWNFLGDRGCKTKILLWGGGGGGEYGYFLELHILSLDVGKNFSLLSI